MKKQSIEDSTEIERVEDEMFRQKEITINDELELKLFI